jgi:hypothetical protein
MKNLRNYRPIQILTLPRKQFQHYVMFYATNQLSRCGAVYYAGERILTVDLGRTRVNVLGRNQDFSHRGFQESRIVASRSRDPRFPARIRAVQTAGTRVRRFRRVGDRGIESPVHMTTGITISRNAISRRVQGQSGDHQG